ncbi:hypothetical protein E4665_13610 [Sporolactobacillus shoreae]|uniref:Uncharacterized protein n=1 Tax=Sporolactobacillus shoreae TaxID=1465501 RepID=A0A4Z0GMC4_9BACL|nr:hypothetical protein [Sporolactobacillus shoreae]TGA96894.1 hypothetical protein E4665_13610 [Sporolactobacillus shoreae]
MLRMEIQRVTRRPIFWFLILVGALLAIWPVVQVWPQISSSEDYAFYPGSPYVMWMPYNIGDTYNIFILILPLLASLAYADAYAEDFNSGYIKNIVTKVSKKKYLMIRYAVNYCLGGTVVVFPLVLNFLGQMTSFPLIENNYYFGMILVPNGNFLPDLNYQHPVLYILLRLFLFFLLGGILASIGLAFSTVLKNRYIVLVVPFLAFMGFDLFTYTFLGQYSISGLFLENGPANWGIPTYLIVGTIGTFLWYYIVGDRHETI